MSEWKKTVDKSTGKTYYYNSKTRETSWSPPPGYEESPAPVAAQPAAAEPAAKEILWRAVEDKSSGRTYYFHKVTKETRWEPPDEEYLPVGGGKAVTGSASPAPASENKPAAAQPAAAPVAAKPAQVAASQPSPAATAKATEPEEEPEEDPANADENWREAMDPNSNRVYYYNKVTKETRWDDPRKSNKEAAQQSSEPKRMSVMTGTRATSRNDLLADEKKQKEVQKPAATTSAAPSSATTSESTETFHRSESSLGTKVKDKKDYRMYLDDEDEEEAKKEEEQFSFMFAKHRKGWVNRTFRTGHILDHEEIMTFKKSLIKKALLKQNRELDAEAIQTFKNIMSYMGDRESSKDQIGHVKKLMRNVMLSPAGLRDEVYLQICKQVTKNPKEKSTLLGWELLALSLATFPPSKPLKHFLYEFFKENIEGRESQLSQSCQERISAFSQYCYNNLAKIMTLGQRKDAPSSAEIEGIRNLKGISVRVYFVDGSFKTMIVDSYTHVSDVRDQIYEKLGLTCGPNIFALYERRDPTHEDILIPADDRLLDVQSAWETLEEKDATAVKDFKIIFKAYLVMPLSALDFLAKGDSEVLRLTYMQIVNDVISGKMPVKDKDACNLAALHLQETYGDYIEDQHGHGWLLGKIDKFIPSDKLSTNAKKAEFEQKVIPKYQKLQGISVEEARRHYLDYASSSEQLKNYFGTAYFSVVQRQFRSYEQELLLGINAYQAALYQPDGKVLLEKWQWEELCTYGFSDEKFIIVVYPLKQTKVVLRTHEGEVMQGLTKFYLRELKDIKGAGISM